MSQHSRTKVESPIPLGERSFEGYRMMSAGPVLALWCDDIFEEMQ